MLKVECEGCGRQVDGDPVFAQLQPDGWRRLTERLGTGGLRTLDFCPALGCLVRWAQLEGAKREAAKREKAAEQRLDEMEASHLAGPELRRAADAFVASDPDLGKRVSER